MKTPLRQFALLLAACLAAAGTAPVTALAQPAVAVAAPAIDSLEVNADAGFLPGSNLEFLVRGTPRGLARVRVAGSGLDLPLRETSPGTYIGSYTVRRTDPLQPSALIHASLVANGRAA